MDLNYKLDKILFEGWEELGIADPGIKPNFKYTDEEISKLAPRPYGLAYREQNKVWDKMRTHPEYIRLVRMSLSQIMDQIAKIKAKESDKEPLTSKLHGLLDELDRISDMTRDIADDIGWRDQRDIWIAIQQHPFVSQLLKIRDGLKK